MRSRVPLLGDAQAYGLVVLDDLIASLDAGHLRSAMLDVFDPEPLPSDHPAWRHPAIVVTCHVAGAARLAARRGLAEPVCAGARLLTATGLSNHGVIVRPP